MVLACENHIFGSGSLKDFGKFVGIVSFGTKLRAEIGVCKIR